MTGYVASPDTDGAYEIGRVITELIWPSTELQKDGYNRSIAFVLRNQSDQTLYFDGSHFEYGLWYPKKDPPKTCPPQKAVRWTFVAAAWVGGTIEGSMWIKVGDGADQINLDFMNKSMGANTLNGYTKNDKVGLEWNIDQAVNAAYEVKVLKK